MKKEDLVVGIYGDEKLEGGRYNVLSSFSKGLLEGFRRNGVKAYTVEDCVGLNLKPNFAIGFNTTGYESWGELLKVNIPTVMWSVDSIFAQNYEVFEHFASNPNFILFTVTPCDLTPLGNFFPDSKYAYFPHATDLNLWKKQDVEKDIDIVLFSSIEDYEKQLQELKESVPGAIYDLMMDFYDFSVHNPALPFWELYQIFKKHRGLNFDVDQYVLVFRSISYILMNEKKAKAVMALKDFNLKIYGEGPWDKYISGNIKHEGVCNLLESIDIMNRAKIALHPQAMQLSYGLHERILNASAVETFVLSSDAIGIKQNFSDSMAYYNSKDFSNIAELANCYLENDSDRMEKAKQARKIVEESHTWEVRAREILKVFGVE